MAKTSNGNSLTLSGLIKKETPPVIQKRKIQLSLQEDQWKQLELYEKEEGVEIPYFVKESILRQLNNPDFLEWSKSHSFQSSTNPKSDKVNA